MNRDDFREEEAFEEDLDRWDKKLKVSYETQGCTGEGAMF